MPISFAISEDAQVACTFGDVQGTGMMTQQTNNSLYMELAPDDDAVMEGLADCLDVDLVENYISRKSTAILEVGAGHGRVVSSLLRKGFNDVSAIESSGQAPILRDRFGTAIKRGSFHLHTGDLAAFKTFRRYDAILWLFGGITAETAQNQKDMVRHLASFLQPEGMIVIDLPAGGKNQLKGPEDLASPHGQAFANILTRNQLERYAIAAGITINGEQPYLTRTGRLRSLHFLGKRRNC